MNKRIKSTALPRRQSTLVSRRPFAAIARREQLNRLLRVHDLETPLRPFTFTESDYAILRQIAREGAMTNIGPAARAAAIYSLAGRPSMENLNLLDQLAEHGEDFYVRSYALLALGQTGLRIAGPRLVRHLEADEPTERLAAERGLIALGKKNGLAALHCLLPAQKWQETMKRIVQMVERPDKRVPKKRGARRITSSIPVKGRGK